MGVSTTSRRVAPIKRWGLVCAESSFDPELLLLCINPLRFACTRTDNSSQRAWLTAMCVSGSHLTVVTGSDGSYTTEVEAGELRI